MVVGISTYDIDIIYTHRIHVWCINLHLYTIQNQPIMDRYIFHTWTGVIILPTQTMHDCREISQSCHRFALFDLPKMGNLMIPDESYGIFPRIVLRHRHVDAGTITARHATVQGRSLWMVGTHRTNHLKESNYEDLQNKLKKDLPFVYFSVSIHYIIYEYNCIWIF